MLLQSSQQQQQQSHDEETICPAAGDWANLCASGWQPADLLELAAPALVREELGLDQQRSGRNGGSATDKTHSAAHVGGRWSEDAVRRVSRRNESATRNKVVGGTFKASTCTYFTHLS